MYIDMYLFARDDGGESGEDDDPYDGSCGNSYSNIYLNIYQFNTAIVYN